MVVAMRPFGLSCLVLLAAVASAVSLSEGKASPAPGTNGPLRQTIGESSGYKGYPKTFWQTSGLTPLPDDPPYPFEEPPDKFEPSLQPEIDRVNQCIDNQWSLWIIGSRSLQKRQKVPRRIMENLDSNFARDSVERCLTLYKLPGELRKYVKRAAADTRQLRPEGRRNEMVVDDANPLRGMRQAIKNYFFSEEPQQRTDRPAPLIRPARSGVRRVFR